MSLERFPDAEQVKILELLEEKCRGGSHPVDGCDAHLISEELAVPYNDLRRPISDLEERGYVRSGVKTFGSPLGRVGITPNGRDLLRDLRAAPQRERQDRAQAKRSFWLTGAARLFWMVVGGIITLVVTLLVLWLAKKLQL